MGTGCPKCKRLEQLVREAVAEAEVDATVLKVEDVNAIMEYPIVSTPALVIEGEVKVSGQLPRKEQIVSWLREAKA